MLFDPASLAHRLSFCWPQSAINNVFLPIPLIAFQHKQKCFAVMVENICPHLSDSFELVPEEIAIWPIQNNI